MNETKPGTPLKAIRAFCTECFGGSVREIKNCTAPRCPLYEFRLGKNPYLKRELTEEQRNRLSILLKENKEKNA